MERLAFTCRIGRATGPARVRPAPGRAGVAQATAPARDRVAYAALLGFIFVLFVRPQDQIPGMSALHLADIFGVLAVIALVAGRLRRGEPVTRITPELVGVLALGAVMVATVPFSFWPGGAFGEFTGLFLKITVIFAVIVNTVTTRRRLERLVTLIVLGAAYVAYRAVFDYARGVNLVEGGRVAGAVSGMFGNPNDMALNMVTFLPLAIALALDRGRPALRLLGTAAVPAMAAATIFSKSRGGTVGLAAMLLVLLFQLRRLRPAVAGVMVVATLAALPMLPASFTDRMASIFDAEQDPTGSREARKTLLREGYRAFLEHPLTGLGAGQFQNYNPDSREEAWRETHNALLQVASELGVVGLGVFLFLVWGALSAALHALRAARRSRQSRAPTPAASPGPSGISGSDLAWLELNSAMAVAAVTGWFVASMFASVAYYWTFYLLLGIAAALRDIGAQAARATGRRRRQALATLRVVRC